MRGTATDRRHRPTATDTPQATDGGNAAGTGRPAARLAEIGRGAVADLHGCRAAATDGTDTAARSGQAERLRRCRAIRRTATATAARTRHRPHRGAGYGDRQTAQAERLPTFEGDRPTGGEIGRGAVALLKIGGEGLPTFALDEAARHRPQGERQAARDRTRHVREGQAARAARSDAGRLPRAVRDCRRSRSMKPTATHRKANRNAPQGDRRAAQAERHGRATGRTGTQGTATGRRHRPSGTDGSGHGGEGLPTVALDEADRRTGRRTRTTGRATGRTGAQGTATGRRHRRDR